MSNTLAVQITVGADGLVEGLKVATKGTETAAQQIRTSFGNSGQGVKDFTDKLKDFKSEQTSQARTARFFAGEVASIIPGAEGARHAIQGLIEVGLEGAGLGAAFQLTLVVLGALRDKFEQAEKQERELRQTGRDATFTIETGLRGISRELDGVVSKTQAFRQQLADQIRKEGKEANDKAQEAVHNAGGIKDLVAAIGNILVQSGRFQKDYFKTTSDEISDYFAKPYETIKTNEANKAKIETVGAEEQKKIAREAANETALIEAQRKDRVYQIRAQLAVDLDQLSKRSDLGLLQRMDREIAMRRKAPLDERKIIQEEQGWKITAEATADTKLRQMVDAQNEYRLARWMTVQKQQERQIREFGEVAKEVGGSFGDLFAGIITGTESAVKGFADLAKAVIAAAVKAIEAYALSASAAAYFSQAGIPIIGPILAIGAAAAAGAFITGLLSQLPSAQGGWAIPSTVSSTLMVAHGGEHVIPKDIAQRYEHGDAGGGDGGFHLHLHGGYIDGASVRKFIASREFRDGMADAQRNGLI